MIVGTAGHIDHGKTTLVRALTGVDTDRLPEEKARGISIELGYAFLDIPSMEPFDRIGFIDVPGHERLVHTMISGATGVDFALLLVAADDGVMPQTREHLAVLSLLGLRRGVVVITKADRADAARIAAVRAEIEAMLAGTSLADAPVLVASAQTGEGIEALRILLFSASRARSPGDARSDDAAAGFRLAIDRVFTLTGVGTVVTGTVHAGRVSLGDELWLTPSTTGLRARVRSVHAQNRTVEEARSGHRCAIALGGIAKDQIARGHWMVHPEVALATDRLDVTLRMWPGEARPLRSGTPVHVHVAAAVVTGTIAMLQFDGFDARGVRPGQDALAQLVLREPIGAWRGDRVILRDASATRTIAGGEVLDPFAPARYRRTPGRLAELAALSLPRREGRLRALIDVARCGVSIERWSRAEGVPDPSAPDGVLVASDPVHGHWVLAASHAQDVADAALSALKSFHEEYPETLGPDSARLRRLVAPRLPDSLWKKALTTLQGQDRLRVRGAFVHLPQHELSLSASDQRLVQKAVPALAASGLEGRWVRDLARDARESEAMMRGALARLSQRGELHQVVKDLYYAPETLARLAAIVRHLSSDSGGVSVARFRDATGLGRKRAIQLLEYFDRIGLSRRVGDEHRPRGDTRLFLAEDAA